MDAALLLSHQGWETLLAHALHELPAESSAAIERIAAENRDVALRMQRVRQFVATLKAARAEAPDWEISASLRRRLIALRPQPAAGWLSGALQQAREVLAALVLDSRAAGPAVAGLRGGASGRLLVYAADGAELELQATGVSGGRVRIIGQVHADEPRGRVLLRCLDSAEESVAPLEEGGVFEIEVAAGLYEVIIELATGRVVLPAVEIESSPR